VVGSLWKIKMTKAKPQTIGNTYKTKLKKEGSQLVSATTQLKLFAPDGKKRLTEMLNYEGGIELAKEFPGKKETTTYEHIFIFMES